MLICLIVSEFCRAQIPSPPVPPDARGSTPLKPARRGEKWGYIDASGKFEVPPQFDSAGEFSEGLAAVSVNQRFGYIDQQGHFAIEPQYFGAAPFKDGLALVCTSKPIAPLGTGEYGFQAFAHFTYIDKSGRPIRRSFPAQYAGNFSEGLAAVKPGAILGGCGKGGYLNKKGEWAIKPQFDELREFSEGFAAVNRGAKCHLGGKWGYIDKDGRVLIPYQLTMLKISTARTRASKKEPNGNSLTLWGTRLRSQRVSAFAER